MLLTCNGKHAADPTVNWETIYLTLCWWSIRLKRVCDLMGLPFTGQDRHANRISIGHWIHGKMMTTGWRTPTPTTVDDFEASFCNIKAQTWPANAFKSNFRRSHLETALTEITGVMNSSEPTPLSDDERSFFLPNNASFRELLENASRRVVPSKISSLLAGMFDDFSVESITQRLIIMPVVEIQRNFV
jgi:hypothetical protein